MKSGKYLTSDLPIPWLMETGKYEEMSQDDKTLIHYCDTIIAVCETVWRACQEKWLHKDEWQYWRRWVQDISASPHFRWTLKWVAQTERQYDERFLKDLMEIIPSRRAAGTKNFTTKVAGPRAERTTPTAPLKTGL